MLRHFKLSLILAIALSFISSSAFAATRYVRCPSLGSSQDGGTGYDASVNPTGQCNGTADSPYDGSGTNENCAWQNPGWALSWKDSSYPQKISGGDTLIITGNCEVGYGADGAAAFPGTSSSYPWDAYMKPVPSGPNSSNKTKIYGSNYLTGTGKSDAFKLVGVERAARVLNLEGSDNVDVRFIIATDGLDCAEFHPKASLACQRSSYPYGKWAPNGIYILDSENVEFHYVYADGLAGRGVLAGRIQDFTWDMGSASGNPYAGWDGDLGDPDNWANGGTVTVKGSATDKFKIDWNGCIHGTPETGNPVASSCFTQGQGAGYGDGWAISDRTGALGGANYVFDHVEMNGNTSDGMDNLYKKTGKTVTITNSKFAHNTGNAIKIAGPATIDATIASGDCDFFLGKSYTYTDEAFTHCRAAGNTIAWNVEAVGNTLDIYSSTITGKGDVLIQSSGANGACNGSERLRVRNSIVIGDTQYGGGDTTDDYYAAGATGNSDGSCGSLAIDWTTSGAGNIIFATKSNDTGAGVTNSDPKLTNKYSDWSIASDSPARGLRNASFGATIDFNGFTRTNASGALEYGSTASSPSCDNTCSLCGSSGTCAASAASCHWWSTNTCNATAEGPICADTCSQCLNQTNCQSSAAGCYWWSNSTCNSTVEPNSCTNTCSACSGQSACQASAAGCFWWNDSTCHNVAQGSTATFVVTGKCSITGRRK